MLMKDDEYYDTVHGSMRFLGRSLKTGVSSGETGRGGEAWPACFLFLSMNVKPWRQ